MCSWTLQRDPGGEEQGPRLFRPHFIACSAKDVSYDAIEARKWLKTNGDGWQGFSY